MYEGGRVGEEGKAGDKLRCEVEKLEEMVHIKWRQRAHVWWMRDGDKNTKFLHAYASNRKKQNRISALWRDDGVVVEGGGDLTNYVLFFSGIIHLI